jgi:hypothetical protein
MLARDPRCITGAVLGLSLVLALGCGDGGGGNGPPAGTPRSADSGFRLTTDAFAFENFAVGYSASSVTPELAARMFGADKVCDGMTSTADYCAPTVGAQGWIDGVNASMDNGRCEGLAVMAQLMHLGDLKPKDFGADTARELVLARNFDLQRELAYWFSTQLVPDAVKNEKHMPKDVLPFLATFLKPDATESYRIGMVQKLPQGFGLSHAVTPIGYVAGEADGIYYIRVYDNNFPGAERAIRLDLKNDAWSYEGVSSTGPISFTGGAANKNPLYFAPVHARLGTLPCPFCDDAGATTVLSAGAVQVAAKDTAGNTNGVVDGEVVEMGGGSVAPGFGLCIDNQCATGAPVTVINAPKAADDVLKLTLMPGDPTMMAQGTSTVRVNQPGATTTISGINTKAGTRDEVTVSDGGKTVSLQSESQQPLKVSSEFKLKDGSTVVVSVDIKGASSGVTVSVDPVTGQVSAKTAGADGTPIVIKVARYGNSSGNSGVVELNLTSAASSTVSFNANAVNGSNLITASVQDGNGAPRDLPANSCVTAQKDADETDIDCGGPTCGKCTQDRLCNVDGDCLSGVCRPVSTYNQSTKAFETKNRCLTACSNGKKDADETDVDCGGTCTSHTPFNSCNVGQRCLHDSDCGGGSDVICRMDTLVCAVARSVVVSASGATGDGRGFDIRLKPDGTREGFSGGVTEQQVQTIYPNSVNRFNNTLSFTRLVGPWSVEITRQPKGALCTPDVAAGDVTGLPAGPLKINVTCVVVEVSCANGKKDAQETDVDCGGADCRAEAAFCALTKGCAIDADCGNPSVKAICVGGTCQKTYDVNGAVKGLSANEQVTLRLLPQGTLTDPTAYKEVEVAYDPGRPAQTDFVMVNTRAMTGPVALQIVSQPASKSCALVNAGAVNPLRTAISGVVVFCTAVTPTDLCADGAKGQNETDIDCGGSDCLVKKLYCGEAKGCATDNDCGANDNTKRICTAGKTCATTYDIGGQVNGDYDQLELQLTPAGTRTSATTARTLTIPVKANPSLPSTFTFTDTRVTAADTYTVSISKAPTNATCTLMNATGKPPAANVTSVVVTCTVNTSSSQGWAAVTTTGLGGTTEGHAGLCALGASDLVAVGDSGKVKRFNGTTWSDMSAGLDGSLLYGVAGTSASAVWVLAEGNVLAFWNGGGWSTISPGLTASEAYAIAANGTINQVYVVGSGGGIAWGDASGGNLTDEFGGGGGYGGGGYGYGGPGGLPGSTPPTTFDLHGVWVGASGRVWAVGDAGTLVWKAGPGGIWQSTTTNPTTKNLRAVWASGDNDAWAVGAGGTIVHFDGSDWTAVASPVTDDLHAVWGASASLVWAAGANGDVLFFDGRSWSKETTPSTTALRALAGVANGQRPFVIGDGNTLLQRN